MNILHTIPVTILPLAANQESREETRDKLAGYFNRNKLALRLALKHGHTERAVKLAAHSCNLWCVRWDNPKTRKWLLAVADKHAIRTLDAMQTALLHPTIEQKLQDWTA